MYARRSLNRLAYDRVHFFVMAALMSASPAHNFQLIAKVRPASQPSFWLGLLPIPLFHLIMEKLHALWAISIMPGDGTGVHRNLRCMAFGVGFYESQSIAYENYLQLMGLRSWS